MQGKLERKKRRPQPAARQAPRADAPQWLRSADVRSYSRGQTIVKTGSELAEWMAISGGTACLVSRVAADTSVAVAALWLGDVIGWGSPLGKLAARYDVKALVDVTTVSIPLRRLPGAGPLPDGDAAQLFAATEARLQDQITMRLAGNGLQRLSCVLATLATALTADKLEQQQAASFALPVSQACIGELSGLSRRQTWILLGQLAKLGWVRTAKTSVTLEGLGAWLGLMETVESEGLDCIVSPEACAQTLARLATQRS